MSRLFLYGAPGVGKTHIASLAGKAIEVCVIEGDQLKSKARQGVSRLTVPFLYLGTCQAYQEYGELTAEHVIKGLRSVRQALREVVIETVEADENMILEGAFLDPVMLQQYGTCFLITCSDEQEHQRRFLQHREKLLDWNENEFRAARIAQEYYIQEAHTFGVQIIDSMDPIDESLFYSLHAAA